MSRKSFIQICHCTIKHLSVTSFPSLCITGVCPPLSCLPSSHTLSNVCHYRRWGKFSHYKNRHNSYCLLHFQKAQTCEWKRENEFPWKTMSTINDQTLRASILWHKVEKKRKHTFRSLRNFHSARESKVCTAEELRSDFKQHRLSSKWAVGTIRVQRKRQIWMGSKTMEKALSFHLFIE